MSENKWKSTEKTEILDDDFLSALDAENKKRYPNNTTEIEDSMDIEVLDDDEDEGNTPTTKLDFKQNPIDNNTLETIDLQTQEKDIDTDKSIEQNNTIEMLNEQIKELYKAQETIEESIELLTTNKVINEKDVIGNLSNKIEELTKTSKNLENTIDLLRLDIPNKITNIEPIKECNLEKVPITTTSQQKSDVTTTIKTEDMNIETEPIDLENNIKFTAENNYENTNNQIIEELTIPIKPSETNKNIVKSTPSIQEKSKKRAKKWPWIILLFTCMIIIGIFTYKTFFWQKDSQKTNKQIEEIVKTTKTKESIIKKENIIGATTPEDDRYFNYLDVDFENLSKQNSDVKGWIKVNNTNINYPFVQSETNDFYLNHSFDKSFNTAGWVFADFRNKFDVLDLNTILYAHGRLDDTMFGSLKKIIEKNWYENMENEFIQMSTLESNTIWQVFSVYTIEPEIYYITPNFETTEEIQDFLETLKERSVHNFQVELNTNDKILTLSSCYNDTLRIVLHAKLVNIEPKIKH